jgi:hypothetical protein
MLQLENEGWLLVSEIKGRTVRVWLLKAVFYVGCSVVVFRNLTVNQIHAGSTPVTHLLTTKRFSPSKLYRETKQLSLLCWEYRFLYIVFGFN